MQTTVILSSSSILKLTKNAKLFTYLSTSLTKIYCDISNDNMILYFKGPKSLLSFRMQLEEPVATPISISIEINKFLSGIKKVFVPSQTLRIVISDIPPSLTIYSPITSDKITFSVVLYNRSSTEIQSLFTFFTEKAGLFDNNTKISINQSLLDFTSITNAYMSTINKNNAIQVTPTSYTYADRTIVITRYDNTFTSSSLKSINLHKFILGFMELVLQESSEIFISTSGDFIKWTSAIDSDFRAIIAIDSCVISIPSEEDIEAISPEDSNKQTLKISPPSLLDSIEFFSGLFEASIWKPITFNWFRSDKNEQKIKLSYKHPATEIEKDIGSVEIDGTLISNNASFTLISDSLRVLLTKMNPEGTVYLHFNDKNPDEAHGAGICLEYLDTSNTLIYRAVLAKLQE